MTSTLKEHAEAIFRSGLKAVDPKEAVKRYLHREGDTLIVATGHRCVGKEYNLNSLDNVYVVGGGKAGAPMAAAIEELLDDKLTSGFVNVKYGHTEQLSKVQLTEAGHPVPDENGVKGVEKIVDLASKADDEDMVICLISGGGSALLPLPCEGITLAEKQETTQKLLACGATINEINAIRKHISQVKGGQLARIASPANLITLMLSDVVGDPTDVIASGPTVPDESTFGDCVKILQKYELTNEIRASVMKRTQSGAAGEIPETPKSGDPAFEKTQNIIVGSNIIAVKAAAEKAEELGYHTLILSTFIEGETREIAKAHAAIAKEIVSSGNPVKSPACVISGGETTVTIKGDGLGGRSQEFALAAATEIAKLNDVLILCAGTDGTDGPTDAAGAFADGSTLTRASQLDMNAQDFLDNNDSYRFFDKLDDLLITGPTNTNVMDVRIVLVRG